MPFFQNPFPEEFKAGLILEDRQQTPTFTVKGNSGRSKSTVVAWVKGPYNLSGNDADGNSNAVLTLSYSLYNTKNWADMSVNVTTGAVSSAAVTEYEIVAALNANAAFAERFNAVLQNYNNTTGPKVHIVQKKQVTDFSFYIHSGRAESVLQFNQRAGVAELPTYFARHTIANRFTYVDSQGMIIQLAPATVNVDADIIDNAVDFRGSSLGYSSATVQGDWQLLGGKSALFMFTKGPSNNAVSTTEVVITYPAGAVAGDFAMKTTTKKDASSVVVTKFEEPYTLQSADLITPP